MKTSSEIEDHTVTVDIEFASIEINKINKRHLALAILDFSSGITSKLTLRNGNKYIEIRMGGGQFKRVGGSVILHADEKQIKDILYIACAIVLGRNFNANHRDYQFDSSDRSNEVFPFLLKIEEGLFKFDEIDASGEFDKIAKKLEKPKH